MIATFPSTNILSSKKIDDEITQFKEIYERLYADSHDRAFNSVTFRYNQPNLFEDYKKSIQFFTSSIVRVAEEDILLDSLANDESARNESSENLYIKYWEIINEAGSEFPHLQEILKNAMKQTIEMLNKGVYVDNHYAITPLGWVAGNHEEVRNYCNKISLKILEDIPEESFVNCLDEFEEF